MSLLHWIHDQVRGKNLYITGSSVLGGDLVVSGTKFTVTASTGSVLSDALAGTGSRTVVASATGVLSAPLAAHDYAGIQYAGGAAVAIGVKDVYYKLDDFAADGISALSVPAYASGKITLGASRAYSAHISVSAVVTSAAAQFEVSIVNIAAAATNITGISEATPGVVTTAGHSFTDGQLVKITGVVGMVEVNDQIFKVAAADATTFALTSFADANIATGGYTSWSSGGTIQLATEIVETNKDFPNGSQGGASTSWPFTGVAGDALEVYTKNEDNTNDITFSHVYLWIAGL